MTNDIREVLENHRKWLLGKDGGSCANLSGANLSYAKLRSADLSYANLYDADLSGANLSYAKLYGANLRGADLSYANLYDADLSGANLSYAKLSNANLRGAILSGAILSYADLSYADLYGASLYGADLSGADLSYADLSYADLSGANLSGTILRGASLYGAILSGAILSGADLDKFFPQVCPDTGSFTAWKKARGGYIVKLLIPEDARRVSAFSRKCRCDKAVCIGIEHEREDAPKVNMVASGRDATFFYEIGKEVTAPDFDENRTHECSTGIHFFITRQEAVDYLL